jgi:exodeoxyribonuclease VII small subunit
VVPALTLEAPPGIVPAMREPAEASPGAVGGGDEEAEPLRFEEALQRLEAIVDRLEQGDLELEASLAAFEEGVALTRRCAGQLEEAERRVEVLVREGERWIPRPFEEAEGTE